MVNLTSVPAYRAPMKQLADSAPLRRAAGYPVSAADSRPALQHFVSVASSSGGSSLQGPSSLPKLPEVGRRLLQDAGFQTAAEDDTSAHAAQSPPVSAAAARQGACTTGAACFAPRGGFAGVDAPPGGAMALAVGRRHIVQTAGDVMSVFNIGADGSRSSTLRTIPLRSFFAGVGSGCTGVDDGAAVYDKHADRFVVAASCGGFGRVLVAVSSTPSAAGTWFLFGLVADGVDTKLSCTAPEEQALADYPQLGYNKDGLFVTYHSYCPSNPSNAGAVLLALPKFKAYQGSPSMYAAVYTSAEVAAAAGLAAGAAAVRQLQPVAPQSADDVAEGVAFFVADHRPRSGAKRSSFTLVSLVNTGALWGYAAEINGVPPPLLLASVVPWGQPAPISSAGTLKQPGGGAALGAGGVGPTGFWSGGAALAHGRLLLATRADTVEDGGLYSPRPGVIWAEVIPQLAWGAAPVNGTALAVTADTCAAAVASGMAAEFDWSKDYSLTWGSEFARNWSMSLGMFRTAAAAKPKAAPRRPSRAGVTGAATVVLDRTSRLSRAADTSPAANFLAMGFASSAAVGGIGGLIGSLFRGPMGGSGYRGRQGSCGCSTTCGYGELQSYSYVYNFDDYCDAGYNQWGPSNSNDMWGSTYNGAYCTGNAAFGMVGNNQYDQCGRWCELRCPGTGQRSAPRYGFYGATNNYPPLMYASLDPNAEASAAEAATAGQVSSALVSAAASAPSSVTKPMKAAACAAAAALTGSVARFGSVDAGGALGLAYPAVAVAPNGAAVLAFVYSGPGRMPDSGADAFPGVGAAFVGAGARGAVPISALQRGDAPIALSTAAGAVTWGELSAADVHPETGAVYVAARRGGATRTQRGTVATWVGLVPQVLAR